MLDLIALAYQSEAFTFQPTLFRLSYEPSLGLLCQKHQDPYRGDTYLLFTVTFPPKPVEPGSWAHLYSIVSP